MESSQQQRIALMIQYLGTRFHGWQRQPKDRSVQGDIEAAIESVLGMPQRSTALDVLMLVFMHRRWWDILMQ